VRGRSVGLLLGLLAAAVVGARASERVGPTAAPAPAAVEAFVARHWRAPLPPQGAPPARFSPLEASLQPEACGTCHPAQYADWRTSWHARAMGPGVVGQLVEKLAGRAEDVAEALACYTCHAPLAEQRPLRPTGAGFGPNPVYDPALERQGVTCAGCHVRAHERFGPPRRDGTLASPVPRTQLPHDGVTRTPAFLASAFCRSCHQFAPDGFALNGKLLEDTYHEWRASRFAREGVQCQDCHMPDRRHLWRGIHDPEMVRSGVAITARVDPARPRLGDTARVLLRLESVRVGHAFPTYVTPRVRLQAELVGPDGAPVPGSRREHVIGREVTLDLSRELADTRLAPGQAATLESRFRLDRPGLRARLRVVVEPDAFYTRFFAALLAQGAGRGAAEIREALEATRRSPFTLFEQELPLR